MMRVDLCLQMCEAKEREGKNKRGEEGKERGDEKRMGEEKEGKGRERVFTVSPSGEMQTEDSFLSRSDITTNPDSEIAIDPHLRSSVNGFSRFVDRASVPVKRRN